MAVDTENPVSFEPLGSYRYPSLPTKDAFQELLRSARLLVTSPSNEAYISTDKLQRSTRGMLDGASRSPACDILLDELQTTLASWLGNPAPGRWLQLIVVPPGSNPVADWANEHHHSTLPEPDRHRLIGTDPEPLPSLTGSGVLVIPQLERWFLRHQHGLAAVRTLLVELNRLERHCVVGCNSWAWAFLCKAVNANMMLPDGLTFQAFDAPRLREWFAHLMVRDKLNSVHFRLANTGADLMTVSKGGKPDNDFFVQLAARSLGIPWVAWPLWRGSLRSNAEKHDEDTRNGKANTDSPIDTENAENDDNTLWVTALEEFSLPGQQHGELALLVLQALLIHGQLSADELRQVIPLVGDSNVIYALKKAGYVEEHGGALSCVAAAYPAIRSGLRTAGFPMDRL